MRTAGIEAQWELAMRKQTVFHTMKQKHTYVTKGENSLTNAQVIEKVKRRRA